MIRLTVPSIEEDDLQAVRAVLETGYLVQGARVAEFEAAVAAYVKAAHAVAVTNCTAALHMALLALDVRPGDLVVVTAYSWIATANVIALCGARPVFVDIDARTFNMDPALLEAALNRLMANRTTAARVRAVLPVHTFGLMADMPAVLAAAAPYKLPVIEDAACALGAGLDGIPAGRWGMMGCFSFHPRKAVTTGEGGIIVTDDPTLAQRLRALRNHGADPNAPAPDFIMPGFNNRMTEFQAALGLTQIRKLDRILAARQARAARYNSLLEGSPFTLPCALPDGSEHTYQSYVVLLPEEAAPRRDRIIAYLGSQGIQSAIGTYHMPMTTYFRILYHTRPGDYPVTDSVAARSLTLPLHEFLTQEEQEQVVHHLHAALEEA